MNQNQALKNIRHVFKLVDIVADAGIRDVFISPGSRNAPLIVAFVRHSAFLCHSVVDERSAAYMALGAAEQSGRPAIALCTSGTATLNFGPAAAEAFYREIPLLLLTADRPPELIDCYDGQAIRQRGIYGRNIKATFEIECPTENCMPEAEVADITRQALAEMHKHPRGPVHINIPIREPFYAEPENLPTPGRAGRTCLPWPDCDSSAAESISDVLEALRRAERPLIVAGQGGRPDQSTVALLERLIARYDIPLLGDITANLHGVPSAIVGGMDVVLREDHPELKPDVLLTFGQGLLSKRLRLFLRGVSGMRHWHISEGVAPDVFGSLVRRIGMRPSKFFAQLVCSDLKLKSDCHAYRQRFTNIRQGIEREVAALLGDSVDFDGASVVSRILANITEDCCLHLGNSLAVRYANLGLRPKSGVTIYSNRGTSGIDGSLSTAVGHALSAPDKQHILIIGDLSFFYDRNALWLDRLPANLRIVVLNNHGGGIFGKIDGPSLYPDARPFFFTPHTRDCRLTAEEFGLDYCRVDSFESLARGRQALVEERGKAVILEVMLN